MKTWLSATITVFSVNLEELNQRCLRSAAFQSITFKIQNRKHVKVEISQDLHNSCTFFLGIWINNYSWPNVLIFEIKKPALLKESILKAKSNKIWILGNKEDYQPNVETKKFIPAMIFFLESIISDRNFLNAANPLHQTNLTSYLYSGYFHIWICWWTSGPWSL